MSIQFLVVGVKPEKNFPAKCAHKKQNRQMDLHYACTSLRSLFTYNSQTGTTAQTHEHATFPQLTYFAGVFSCLSMFDG